MGVGYRTHKKRDITGAVATFNASNLDERTKVPIDQLMAERRREFIAEGKRWHDLVRIGKVLTVMAAFDASEDLTSKMNPIIANDPRAQSQLSVSRGLYTQNPDYLVTG